MSERIDSTVTSAQPLGAHHVLYHQLNPAQFAMIQIKMTKAGKLSRTHSELWTLYEAKRGPKPELAWVAACGAQHGGSGSVPFGIEASHFHVGHHLSLLAVCQGAAVARKFHPIE